MSPTMGAVTVIDLDGEARERVARALRELGLEVRLGSLDAAEPPEGPAVVRAAPEQIAGLRDRWPLTPLVALVRDAEEGDQACAEGADEFALAGAGAEELAARVAAAVRRRVGELAHRDTAHELRTPLNVALGHLRMLLDGARGALASGQREALGVVERQARRMLDTLDAVGKPAARPAPPPEPRPEERGARRRPLILVVEDEDASRQAVCELLSQRFEVVEADNGERGIQLARERRPDLVLMDLRMPGMDGLAALEQLRASPDTEETPVLLLSARGDVPTKVRGLALGAADYLTKPFSAPELMARVERTLRTTEQREHYRALAQTDALTGLPNYRAFRARLDEEVKRARRYANDLAAVMADIDNLKDINDRWGHAAGNQAIATAADVLRAELRGTDFAARYGGDEFVVLLPHTSARDAQRFAERAQRTLAAVRAEGEIAVQASFGVASMLSTPAADAESLLRSADRALYAAKRAGRNRIVVAEP